MKSPALSNDWAGLGTGGRNDYLETLAAEACLRALSLKVAGGLGAYLIYSANFIESLIFRGNFSLLSNSGWPAAA